MAPAGIEYVEKIPKVKDSLTNSDDSTDVVQNTFPDVVTASRSICTSLCNNHDRSCTDGDCLLNDTYEQDPIAVIGMAVKFPQEAFSLAAFWQMLMNGRSALTDVPKERFNIDAFYNADSAVSGTLNARGGHFITEDLAAFDAPFFSISPAEAECIDPQQRWLLETTYHALENAGIPLEKIAATKTAVHVGSFMHDYETILSREIESSARYKATGTSLAMLANRISWFYNLTGPSIAIDSACSSSLNALDLSCQCIGNGQSTMGIVAGSNLILNPDPSAALADLGFLSPDSKCYSFDHRANGYARGEGIGVVIIKRLSDALRDDDIIRAVIRATGSNQDGRTPGVSQPSSKSQEDLIRQTYSSAGLDLSSTSFFEAHGTGTPIGDPTEISGIQGAFQERVDDKPLYIGAVKTNIGHLGGASGLAGLIKTVLVLEKGIIPPNVWFEKQNPLIDPSICNIKFPVKPISLGDGDLRRASVNSFGFGGSNCHAVLDDAHSFLQTRRLEGRHSTDTQRSSQGNDDVNGKKEDHNWSMEVSGCTKTGRTKPMLLVFSAQDEGGLKRISALYKDSIRSRLNTKNEARFLIDLAFTLAKRRTHLRWRTFAIADSVGKLQEKLCQGLPILQRSTQEARIAFIFTGQGAEWYGMGRDLFDYSVFKKSLEASQAHLLNLGCEWNLLDQLSTDRNIKLHRPAYSQPIVTALQIALIGLLYSWGVHPSCVIGHSSGEIAAAYCVGGLSHASALKVAYCRGLLADSLVKDPPVGAMIAVGLSESEARECLSQVNLDGKLCIACINSSRSVTIAGSLNDVNILKDTLEVKGAFHRKLNVPVAYHSEAMQAIVPEYRSRISDIEHGNPMVGNLKMFSSLTGELCEVEELRKPEYWIQNMISPVKFMHALLQATTTNIRGAPEVRSSETLKCQIEYFCEIGPHRTLKGPIVDILKSSRLYDKVGYTSLLMQETSAVKTALEAAGTLHCIGCPINFSNINHDLDNSEIPGFLPDLPSYPFNRSRSYWLEGRQSKNTRFRNAPPHALLGHSVSDWNSYEARWSNFVGLETHPWVEDHRVNGSTIYPGAGLLIMAIEAARQTAPTGGLIVNYHLRDLTLSKAAMIPHGGSVEMQVTLQKPDRATRNFLSWSEFRIYIYEGCESAKVSSGFVALEYENNGFDAVCENDLIVQDEATRDHTKIFSHCKMSLSSKQYYEGLNRLGYYYGSAFQNLRDIRYNFKGDATALMKPYPWISKISNTMQPNIIHPAALDSMLNCQLVGMTRGLRDTIPTMVPTKVARIQISAELYGSSISVMEIAARRNFMGPRSADYTITAACKTTGKIHLDGIVETTATSYNSSASLIKYTVPKQICYSVKWKPDVDLMTKEQISVYCECHLEPTGSLPILMLQQRELLCRLALSNVNNNLDINSPFNQSPHFRRYREWMNTRVLSPDLSSHNETLCNPTSLEDLQARIEQLDPAGEVLVAVSRNLKGILEGSVDALQLLFSDKLMDRYYQFLNTLGTAFQRLAVFIDLLAHKDPNMNILEIGAGTGSATRDMLHSLVQESSKRFRAYTFTDLSPSFFTNAREEFGDYSERMTYLPLDIEKDPLRQGFKAEYDVVVASNVLHATTNLEKTLQNTRKLLKRGGRLILYEAVDPESLISTFTFGLLPGWWHGTESFRKWGPLVDEATWNRLLTKTGFSSINVSFQDSYGSGLYKTSVMIASAVDEHFQPFSQPRMIFVEDNPTCDRTSANSSRTIFEKTANSLSSRSEIECDILTYSQFASEDLRGACVFMPSCSHDEHLKSLSREFNILQKILGSAVGLVWILDQKWNSGFNHSAAAMGGLLRSIRNENEDFKVISVQVTQDDQSNLAIEQIAEAFQKEFSAEPSHRESEYQSVNSLLAVPRVVQSARLNKFIHSRTTTQNPEQCAFRKDTTRNLKLNVGTPGLLETLGFVDDISLFQPIASDEIEVEVKATGVNFRDVLIALGQMKSEFFGSDCAGVVTQAGHESDYRVGDRVTSIVLGSYQTRARCKAAAARKIPDDMSFASAAALPTPFITAYYSLVKVARIQSQESVLIHSAAGSTGQACVQIAKLYDAIVFATAGTEKKRTFLHQEYGIPKEHIFTSRKPIFAAAVRRMTQGRGVDIIINSLTGEALQTTWEQCLAPLGRFIEIGKKDIHSSSKLSMSTFAKNAMFTCVDLFVLYLIGNPGLVGEILGQVLALFQEGKITLQKPLRIFRVSQIQEAFRWMQSGTNVGKSVVEFGDEDMVAAVPSTLPAYYLDPKATYIIAGGSGGLGRSTARWMAAHNARNIILLSRSGSSTQATKDLVDELDAQGVVIAAPSCDVSDREALERILESCFQRMPPIKGCIQGAMVLRDCLFANMSYGDFNAAIEPKVQGSWNLHTLLPKRMDFFILLSSIAGIIGNRGQSNYAAGNTFQDELARYRIANSEKAVSIDLGSVRHVGYLAEHEDVATTLKSDRYISLEEAEFHALLEHFCDPSFVPTLENCQVATGLETAASLRSRGLDELPFMTLPMFRHLFIASDDDGASSNRESVDKTTTRTDYQSLLSLAKSLDEAAATVTQGLLVKLSAIMALATADIDTAKPLHTYGVDSLAAVEIRTWLIKEMGSEVAVFDLLSGKSIEELGRFIASKNSFVQGKGKDDSRNG